MAAEPKELYVVEDAEHIDLYDRVDRIPFDKLEAFFREHLKYPRCETRQIIPGGADRGGNGNDHASENRRHCGGNRMGKQCIRGGAEGAVRG